MNLASPHDSKVSLRTRFRTATREAILDAAADLLGAEGAAQTRMEDIASRAGVAVGTVYNYFKDRTALVSALLETRTASLIEALDTPPERRKPRTAEASRDPFQLELEHFIDTLMAHIEANRVLLALLIEDERQRGVDADSASRRSAMRAQVLERGTRLVEKGIKTKALRKEEPAVYAALLLGMVKGAAHAAVSSPKTASTAWAASIVHLFLHGASR